MLRLLPLIPLVLLAPPLLPPLLAQLEDPGAVPATPLLPPPAVPAAPSLPPPRAAAPPLQFDRSLQELERQGAITIRERQQLEQGGSPLRIGGAGVGGPPLQELCRTGVMSQRECARAQGVAFLGRDSEGRPFRVSAEGLPLPPLTVPVSALLVGGEGSFSLANVLRVTPRPAPLLGNGNRGLLFPLIGSAITTSGFGWRLHPILGSMILHAGRDLAAPEGTPVVAALDGTVMSAGFAGGYGLAVELEHRRPLRRSLYGHLSELFVQPGEKVHQGDVIGRVGSTGLSTGPHLHFEVRRPEGDGWVAIDPGSLSPSPGEQGQGDVIAVLMDQLLKGLARKS